MPDFDFFNFFRWALGTVVTIYATIVTVNWALDWHEYLSQPGRTVSMLGRYLLIHGLRIRLLRFIGDLVICLLLCVIFVMLVHAHTVLGEAYSTDSNVPRSIQHSHRAG